MNLPRYAKAITAFLGAGVAAFVAAYADGNISVADVLAIIVALIGTPAAVAAIPNRPTVIKSSVHDVP